MKIFTQRYAKYIALTILFFILLLVSVYCFNNLRTNKLEKINIEIAERNISTLVADNKKSHKEGLSIVDKINVDEAMLFVFDEIGFHNFWMKDMKFSIDIVWLDEYKNIVYIKEHASPNDYPETYNPGVTSLYVLEFKDGFVKDNDIETGDTVRW